MILGELLEVSSPRRGESSNVATVFDASLIRSMSSYDPEGHSWHNLPLTPPRNVYWSKRRFERSNSPTSTSSSKHAERLHRRTKALKRLTEDHVRVEELADGDEGYSADIDVVFPHELEEAGSDSDGPVSDPSQDESDDSITNDFSRLRCEGSTRGFKSGRRHRELDTRERAASRVFKRSHSQSTKDDPAPSDSDAMADHDLSSGAKRPRRRTVSPVEDDEMADELTATSFNPPDQSPIGSQAQQCRRNMIERDVNLYGNEESKHVDSPA